MMTEMNHFHIPLQNYALGGVCWWGVCALLKHAISGTADTF